MCAKLRLTDADFLRGDDGRVDMFEDSVGQTSTANRKHKVVAVGVGERPVSAGVARVPRALETQRQNSVDVRNRRVLHVLSRVQSWWRVPILRPSETVSKIDLLNVKNSNKR